MSCFAAIRRSPIICRARWRRAARCPTGCAPCRPARIPTIHGRDIRTVKQCPPFVDAMSYGFMILLPCDVTVDRGAFSWDWNVPGRSPRPSARAAEFSRSGPVSGAPFATDGRAALKFNSFWTIELEQGWSLFATHPVNRLDLPFRLVLGRWIRSLPRRRYQFPGDLDRAEFRGTLPKGTPVAQCFAVPREPYELVVETSR